MGLVSDKISSIEGRIDANIEKFQSDNNVQASETFEYAIFASIGGYVYKLSLLIIETMWRGDALLWDVWPPEEFSSRSYGIL